MMCVLLYVYIPETDPEFTPFGAPLYCTLYYLLHRLNGYINDEKTYKKIPTCMIGSI